MKKVLLAVAVLLLSTPLFAGIRFTMHLETQGEGQRTDIVQNAWWQGERAKLMFDEGVGPEREFEADRYGELVSLIDPGTHRPIRFSLEKQAHQSLPVVVSNIVTKKLLQEPGPTILGHATMHLRFSSTFDYVEQGETLKGSILHELWVTTDVPDPDLATWLVFQYQLRQNAGIESLFRQVSMLGRGLPLAYDGRARIQDDTGNTHIYQIGAKVDSLDVVNIDPSVFTGAANTFYVVANGQ